jgi:sialidase-1
MSHFIFLAFILGPAASSVVDTPLPFVDLYSANQNDTKGVSYDCFRIPSLVRTKGGSIIAFAEGRRGGCGDQGDVRIVSRRSDDGGASWGPIEQVRSENGHTIGNPSPITDESTGTVWLLYARDDNQVFVTNSEDEGKSWGISSNVTAQLKQNPDPKGWIATGPPGGVQLASGRLVTAAYYNRADKQTRAFAVFSDDHGKTWLHGADVGIDSTPGSQVWGGGESQLVKFGGDKGMAMLIRARTAFENDEPDNVDHNHAMAFSKDGGTTWSNSTRLSGIKTVYCEGSITAADNGDLLISSPSTGNGVRANTTVWAAKKASPTNFQYLLTLYSGSSAYSSMLSLQSGGDYINLFEREGSKYISMVKFKYPQ